MPRFSPTGQSSCPWCPAVDSVPRIPLTCTYALPPGLTLRKSSSSLKPPVSASEPCRSLKNKLMYYSQAAALRGVLSELEMEPGGRVGADIVGFQPRLDGAAFRGRVNVLAGSVRESKSRNTTCVTPSHAGRSTHDGRRKIAALKQIVRRCPEEYRSTSS